VLDAIERVAKSGKPVNRSNVRDAMQSSNVKTLQGQVSFDEVFAIGALGGLTLAFGYVLRGRFAPWALSLLHAALGAAGLLSHFEI
jgi:hypothetical protein